MRITISINDITRRIYAISAIKAVNASEGTRPAVLTRDNAGLLRRLIRDCFALTVGSLGSRVSDFTVLDPDDESDILWLDMDVSGGVPGVAAENLASAVLGRVLSLAYDGYGSGVAAEYSAVADEALGRLGRMAVHCGRLRGSFC